MDTAADQAVTNFDSISVFLADVLLQADRQCSGHLLKPNDTKREHALEEGIETRRMWSYLRQLLRASTQSYDADMQEMKDALEHAGGKSPADCREGSLGSPLTPSTDIVQTSTSDAGTPSTQLGETPAKVGIIAQLPGPLVVNFLYPGSPTIK